MVVAADVAGAVVVVGVVTVLVGGCVVVEVDAIGGSVAEATVVLPNLRRSVAAGADA